MIGKTQKKGIGACLLCLLALLTVPWISHAQEEVQQQEEELTEVELTDVGMTVQMPQSCYLLTQEIEEDNPYLEKVGGDRELIENYYAEAGIVLNAIAQDDSYEIVVTMNQNQAVNYIYNMQSLSDEQISEFADTIQSTYESYGYTVSGYDLYRTQSAKYVVFSFGQIYEEQKVQCRQYYTIRDSRIYNITLRSYTGEVTQEMQQLMDRIVDSISYEEETQGIEYDDSEAGMTMSLEQGWSQITLQEQADNSYIRAQYMHSNGLGESIQFLSMDIWGNMDSVHQLVNTRSDYDAGRQLEQSEMDHFLRYISSFFSAESKISQQQIQGEWYFVSDTPMEITSETIQGTYKLRSVAAIRNGILYVWQYGYYEGGNLHESDFEAMLESIEYREAGFLRQDEQRYEEITHLVRNIFLAVVLLFVIVMAAFALYHKSFQEHQN